MSRPFRLGAFFGAFATVMLALAGQPATTAMAQSPAQSPAQTPPQTAPAAPAAPAPATPETPPAATPAPPPVIAAPPAGDAFAAEVQLDAKDMVSIKGNATWDSAFETITGAMKTITAFLDKAGVKAAGGAQVIYTSTDDTGFTYEAGIPVSETPKNLPKNMAMSKTPQGKALKFIHRGSYDNMDNTYEAITNHLDDKQIEAKDMFIEEYVTDPLKTAEDKLVINVFVPLK
jgi:effector-binding domain-containing protein